MKNIQKIYDRSISQINLLSSDRKRKLKPINYSSFELENNNINKRLMKIYSKMPLPKLNMEFNIVSNHIKMSRQKYLY